MRVELPPGPVHFVNRDEERETALRAVRDWRDDARPPVLRLDGPAGMGKTELARLLARALRDRHPDGVLSVDLDDFRFDEVLDPGDVLARFLESLGVEPQLVATGFPARCRQYWDLTSRTRLTVLVDNARYASEVVPLLPASGGNLVIVASHGPLHDLADGAAVGLTLPPLDETAATELLGLVARDPRLAADPEATRALVGSCAGLPAALHVAGRRVRAHRLRPLSRLIPSLRCDLREAGAGPDVEGVWDAVCDELPYAARLLYRLLPHHPGTTFTLESATALLGRGPSEGEEALEALDGAGLLDLRAMETEDGRMRLCGPMRAHALRRSRREAADGEVAEAQTRLLRWLVRQAQRADLFAAGRRLTVADPVAPLAGAPDAPLADPEQTDDPATRTVRAEAAARWLTGERLTLFAALRLAHERGLDAEAVALSEPLWTYALDHPHQSDVVGALRLAVSSAVRHGARATWLVRTRLQLARPLWESDRLSEAGSELDAAEAALGLLGNDDDDRKLRASAIEFRGVYDAARGDWRAAADAFVRAREAHREIPNRYGVMLMTYRLGEAHLELDELDAAHELLAEAHAEAEALGRARMTGRTGFALAGVLRRLGRTAEARPLYERSLRAARQRGSDFDQARVHDALAELAADEGRDAEAAENRAASHDIRRRNGLAPDGSST
ncbi:hypothetical protein E0L36_12510 [Streptomyces sp. AJS327]|uniref:hypothetical protein n=1 Tax=Streptomyces sp. AJS327 TaxID=2545265 RepID=UPI0015DDFB55|nr:hypothetical protein [Streptomyces sp. AJS327]MBA0051689.1 hypothetical protein [Streptomyces sp. AJS327]